jgi:hypothetical protein
VTIGAENADGPVTIADAIARMEAIDAALAPADGVACFNRMYLEVTRMVGRNVAAGTFADAAFMSDLDVVFAGLYLSAVGDGSGSPARAPRAWRPLIERRSDPRISSIQFAVAGMNAHINRDLPVAVVETCRRRRTAPSVPPHHDDYRRIDPLLEQVEAQIRQSFEHGTIRQIDTHLAPIENIVSNWSIVEARSAAWTNALTLWELRGLPALQHAYLSALDGTVGFAGRGVLVPIA